jgi:hypothetical protein
MPNIARWGYHLQTNVRKRELCWLSCHRADDKRQSAEGTYCRLGDWNGKLWTARRVVAGAVLMDSATHPASELHRSAWPDRPQLAWAQADSHAALGVQGMKDTCQVIATSSPVWMCVRTQETTVRRDTSYSTQSGRARRYCMVCEEPMTWQCVSEGPPSKASPWCHAKQVPRRQWQSPEDSLRAGADVGHLWGCRKRCRSAPGVDITEGPATDLPAQPGNLPASGCPSGSPRDPRKNLF